VAVVVSTPLADGTMVSGGGAAAEHAARTSAPGNASHSGSKLRRALRRPRLAWPPPPLVRPITIKVTGTKRLFLDPNRDYVLKLPKRRPLIAHDNGCLWIMGGHNIVIIGGECYADRTSDQTEGNGRVFYVEGNTGTVHIEGIWAHGPGLTEGIDLFSDSTTLQLENCRFDNLTQAGKSDIHSDLIQADSAQAVKVDRFTGSTEVQGFFRAGSVPAPRGADFRRVNISKNVSRGIPARALWQDDAFWYPMKLSRFYLEPLPGRTVGNSVWPGAGDLEFSSTYRAIVGPHGSVSWPPAAHITGVVQPGRPRGGAFVPMGVAGLKYLSPGYQTRRTRGLRAVTASQRRLIRILDERVKSAYRAV
jgi:hypothetical protein